MARRAGWRRAGWLARRAKLRAEFDWWRRQRALEGDLEHIYYERLFTEPFSLPRSYYHGRSILDVGCGPRGSLEWADDARERVGLDPLADRYQSLGADRHRMRYVNARGEAIPFEDGRFDVVSAFNGLDHVEDLRRVASEITRVTAPGGLVLLIVEVNHQPTITEPLTLDWNLTRLFEPALEVSLERHIEKKHAAIHASVLLEPTRFDTTAGEEHPGVLVAMLRKPRG
jgi:ubiquinone/menaquinone biosynthesis C-methylase UbiE